MNKIMLIAASHHAVASGNGYMGSEILYSFLTVVGLFVVTFAVMYFVYKIAKRSFADGYMRLITCLVTGMVVLNGLIIFIQLIA